MAHAKKPSMKHEARRREGRGVDGRTEGGELVCFAGLSSPLGCLFLLSDFEVLMLGLVNFLSINLLWDKLTVLFFIGGDDRTHDCPHYDTLQDTACKPGRFEDLRLAMNPCKRCMFRLERPKVK